MARARRAPVTGSEWRRFRQAYDATDLALTNPVNDGVGDAGGVLAIHEHPDHARRHVRLMPLQLDEDEAVPRKQGHQDLSFTPPHHAGEADYLGGCSQFAHMRQIGFEAIEGEAFEREALTLRLETGDRPEGHAGPTCWVILARLIFGRT
jgi:hypothetical protein